MSVQITKATIADISALNKLINSAYRGEESKKGWSTEADMLDGTRIDEALLRDLIQTPNTTFLKYEEEGAIIGCVELRREGSKLYLGTLSVNPNIQNKGIGKKLLQAGEEHARQEGCSTMRMTVIDSRQSLLNWYVRHGYHLTGERKPFDFPDERWGIPRQKLEFVVLEKTV